MTPTPTTPPPDGEDLFDQWLDAALAGDIEDPAAFCARHGAGASLRMAIERIQRQLHPSSAQHPRNQEQLSSPHHAEDDLPFETLGEFRLLRRLGEGGMGTVFLAEQPSLDRLVALKVMRPEVLATRNGEQRFDLEARAVARLRHPHVVTMFDTGEDRGVRYLVMELVPGRSLNEVLAAGSVPTNQLVQWCREIGEALVTAHSEGILHRDIKPSNIRIDPNDRAVLLDFGLARDLLDDGPAHTMQFAGSPHYASPEQRRADRDAIDERTDIYSLGVVLYEGLAGKPPYSGSTLEEVVQQAVLHDPEPVRKRNPRVSPDLAIVVGKAMEREPTDRYATMRALTDDLAAVLELRPVTAVPPTTRIRLQRWCGRHRGVVATALAMTAVLLLVVGLWIRTQ